MNPVSTRPAAVIFDMDGVLIDSNPIHLQKWSEHLKEHQIPFNPAELAERVLGWRNDFPLKYYFGDDLTDEQIVKLSEELETKFRSAFEPRARSLPGLRKLIEEIHARGVPMAVASAAMAQNVEFVVDALGLRPYFRCLVTSDDVSMAKPHPEIYLTTARKLGVEPGACVAFEDTVIGVESAKGAGMRCVAVASTLSPEELRTRTQADLIVPDFSGITLHTLQKLFGNSLPTREN